MLMITKTHRETILVIDDSAENIAIITEILGDCFRVKAAVNGEKGLEVIRSADPPDLVLLDMVMPGMSGLDVAEEIKGDAGACEIPVIFVTGEQDKEMIVRGFKAGAQDYVTKPFNEAELMVRIETHLEMKRHRERIQSLNQELEIKVAERTGTLKIALENKESLLQELHHRVNNNLQMLSSMVRLQTRLLSDQATAGILEAYLRRLQIMGIVHHMVNSEQYADGVDLHVFMQKVINSLYRCSNTLKDTSAFKLDIEKGRLPLNMAIPLGLIMHEIVTYTLKWQESKKITFTINAACPADSYWRISILHSGRCVIPVEDHTDFSMQLITLLMDQLQGTMNYNARRRMFELELSRTQIKTFATMAY